MCPISYASYERLPTPAVVFVCSRENELLLQFRAVRMLCALAAGLLLVPPLPFSFFCLSGLEWCARKGLVMWQKTAQSRLVRREREREKGRATNPQAPRFADFFNTSPTILKRHLPVCVPMSKRRSTELFSSMWIPYGHLQLAITTLFNSQQTVVLIITL